MVENLTRQTLNLAWREVGGSQGRLTFGDTKRYQMPINSAYIQHLPEVVKNEISAKKNQYFYRAQVDVHVFLDKKMVMAVECKTYAENAMLKRILVDFQLLKTMHPNLICCLLQLESQLGGDYSETIKETPILGSTSSHSLMSYFPDVDLNILTLLEGERKVDQPIHNPDYFKELKPERLNYVINRFQQLLTPLI